MECLNPIITASILGIVAFFEFVIIIALIVLAFKKMGLVSLAPKSIS